MVAMAATSVSQAPVEAVVTVKGVDRRQRGRMKKEQLMMEEIQ